MIARALAVSLALLCTAAPVTAACDSQASAEIYPTASVLPENLLRIYVYFPRAMDLSTGMDVVRLRDSAGHPVDGVFLKNRDDLWSPDRRRLTLLLDPGRVKTGLNAHDALGRALVPGQDYEIEVSGAALGADGCPLGRDMRHRFTASSADLTAPNPARWQFEMPRAQTKDPLRLLLGDPHDHLSLAFRVRVVGTDGGQVRGVIALGPEEAEWIFTPAKAWSAAPHAIVIDQRLEDLAGNRPGVLFDRPIDAPPAPWQNRIRFTPLTSQP